MTLHRRVTPRVFFKMTMLIQTRGHIFIPYSMASRAAIVAPWINGKIYYSTGSGFLSGLRAEARDGASVLVISVAPAQSITSPRPTWPCVGVISKSVANNVDQCHRRTRIDHSSRSSARTSIHRTRLPLRKSTLRRREVLCVLRKKLLRRFVRTCVFVTRPSTKCHVTD